MFNNKWISCLIVLVAILMTRCSSDDEIEVIDATATKTSWQLVWSDEFTGNKGQAINSQKWAFDIGTNWGNNQLEYDTESTKNVSLDGQGNLAITAHKESYKGAAYTSGRIKTEGLYAVKYGKIEARIKLPVGQGVWPAFWMLGNNFSTVGWPQCGEIDIMEYRGQQPSIVHGSLHGPNYYGGGGLTTSYTLPNAAFNDDFHIFGIEWGADVIKYYVDGVLYQTITASSSPGQWVNNQSFFLILNLAIGGTFVGAPNSATVFPQTMLVDYVRVYQ